MTTKITPANISTSTSTISVILNNTATSTSTTTGALVVSGGVGIGGNLNVGGSGRFNGAYNETGTTTTVALYLGVSGDAPVSPRIGFANSGTTWQIDNFNGTFRWYIPNASKMELSTSGNLTVTSGSVLLASGQSLFVGGAQQTNGPAFSAYAAAILQTIPSGSSQTKVLFQTEEFDTNNNYANSTFTPTIAGYYQLNAMVRLDGASGTGENMIILWKNGAEYKRGWNSSGVQFASNFFAMTVSTLVYANGTGDYFEIYVQQGNASSVTVTAVNGINITYFNGCMLRGA